MRFSKFGLHGLGVVIAEQRHPQIGVGMRESQIDAHRFAILPSGVLIFLSVEKGGAVIEPDIGTLRLQGHDLKRRSRPNQWNFLSDQPRLTLAIARPREPLFSQQVR